MSTISLNLPDAIHERIKLLAQRDGISVDQFVADRLAATLGDEYLDERARRGNPAAFERALAMIPDVPPVPGDELR